MQDAVQIDPRILNSFCAWFNGDLIDLADVDEMESLAGTVAADLMQDGMEADAIVANLSAALEGWTSRVAMQFVRYTNVDWLCDDATEAQLKSIVAKTIEGAHVIQARAQKAS